MWDVGARVLNVMVLFYIMFQMKYINQMLQGVWGNEKYEKGGNFK